VPIAAASLDPATTVLAIFLDMYVFRQHDGGRSNGCCKQIPRCLLLPSGVKDSAVPGASD
jgi:hypothetical protein